MESFELESLLETVKDEDLQNLLSFGIGMHHAGLEPQDRRLVEELFANQKILVLVCTATLAWGVNLPAHLVVVKGTEYFDGKEHRYVDLDMTDIMQMAGRAGRPQYDDKVPLFLFFLFAFLAEPFHGDQMEKVKSKNTFSASW